MSEGLIAGATKLIAANEPEFGLVVRQYRKADGTTFTTYEMPATVVRRIGLSGLHIAMDQWKRNLNPLERNRTDRGRQAVGLIQRGLGTAQIAKETGLSKQQVCRIRNDLKQGG